MNATLYNQEGKTVGEITLPTELFERKWNPDLVHRVAVAMSANARMPIAHTKDRSEVSGGGRKPWQQKGTGRARHGSSRSPIWVHGGVHGPRNDKVYTQKINKRERYAALLSILSKKASEGEVLFVDALNLKDGKTKTAGGVMAKLAKATEHSELTYKSGKRAIVGVPAHEEMTARSLRNLPVIAYEMVRNLSVADLVTYKYLILVSPEESFKVLSEGRTGQKKLAPKATK